MSQTSPGLGLEPRPPGIPPDTYNDADQVTASVTIADDRDVQGAARRTHAKPGLAESAQANPVQSPIVDELGENRGPECAPKARCQRAFRFEIMEPRGLGRRQRLRR